MTILHVADLHNDDRWLRWVAAHCVEFDLLAIAGDLQNAFSPVGMHAQAKQLREWLSSLRPRRGVCVVDGNHDYWTARGSVDVYAEGGWLRTLGSGRVVGQPGGVIDLDGLSVACNGWLQVPNVNRPVDVLITHAPPSGCQCAIGAEGRDAGDPDLWPAVSHNPPTLVLSGHIHEPKELACTWPPVDPTSLVLVTGCDGRSQLPSHWIIDTERQLASHSSGQKVCWREH